MKNGRSELPFTGRLLRFWLLDGLVPAAPLQGPPRSPAPAASQLRAPRPAGSEGPPPARHTNVDEKETSKVAKVLKRLLSGTLGNSNAQRH